MPPSDWARGWKTCHALSRGAGCGVQGLSRVRNTALCAIRIEEILKFLNVEDHLHSQVSSVAAQALLRVYFVGELLIPSFLLLVSDYVVFRVSLSEQNIF